MTVREYSPWKLQGDLEVFWRDQGWREFAAELAPGPICAELQELEESR